MGKVNFQQSIYAAGKQRNLKPVYGPYDNKTQADANVAMIKQHTPGVFLVAQMNPADGKFWIYGPSGGSPGGKGSVASGGGQSGSGAAAGGPQAASGRAATNAGMPIYTGGGAGIGLGADTVAYAGIGNDQPFDGINYAISPTKLSEGTAMDALNVHSGNVRGALESRKGLGRLGQYSGAVTIYADRAESTLTATYNGQCINALSQNFLQSTGVTFVKTYAIGNTVGQIDTTANPRTYATPCRLAFNEAWPVSGLTPDVTLNDTDATAVSFTVSVPTKYRERGASPITRQPSIDGYIIRYSTYGYPQDAYGRDDVKSTLWKSGDNGGSITAAGGGFTAGTVYYFSFWFYGKTQYTKMATYKITAT